MNVDLIVTNIGQLVTSASPTGPKRGRAMRDVGMIKNAAVAISGEKFVAVGQSAAVAEQYDAEVVIDAGGRVVTPGFVDPHTHIVFAGDRLDEFELKIQGADYLEILAGGGGIISTVRETRTAAIDNLVADGNSRLGKMLVSGTTTAEIKTGYGLDTATELKMLRAISEMDRTSEVDLVPTFLAAHAIPPEFRNEPETYVDLICDEMLPKAMDAYRHETDFPRTGVPIFADVFCEKNAFDLRQTERILRAASALGFKLKAHVDEFTNLGGSRLSIDMRATSIDHLDAISDEEIDMLAKSDTIAVVTPTVNFNFGSCEFADARKLIDSGCAVALSTDYNPGSAPSPSQPMAMAIACRYQKLLPSEVINAATINAAHAIGLGDRVGSIEVGKVADMLVLDCRDHRTLANEFGGNLVRTVLKKGRRVYGSE